MKIRLNRPLNEIDLQDKGYPFACTNCGYRPTPCQVLTKDCVCPICNDEIIAYTLDSAKMINELERKLEQKENKNA